MSLIGGALSNSAGRSREGAWIEITDSTTPQGNLASLPRGSVD